jgi:hypothetical protein
MISTPSYRCFKKLADIGKKLVGIGFVIIEQTDALVYGTRISGSRLGSFGNSGAVGLTIFISSRSMLVPSQNLGLSSGSFFCRQDYCVVRI